MLENIKPAGGGFSSRTLWLSVVLSVGVHLALFGAGHVFAGSDERADITHSGDVIQLTEFEVKRETQPKALDADQKTKAPDSPDADPKGQNPNAKPKPPKKPKIPKQPRTAKTPDNNGAVVVTVGADGGAPEPDAGTANDSDGGAGEEDDPDAPPPAASADLGPYAPGDARLIAIVHADRIRTSAMRAGAEELLDALPDTKMILDGTGLRAFDDFDTILVATSDPADISQTFLAGRGLAGAEKMMKSLSGEGGKRVKWTRMQGRAVGVRPKAPGWDPRLYVVAGPKWMVFGRPDQLGALGDTTPEAASGDAGSAPDGGASGDGGTPADAPVPPAWSKRLGQIRTVAGEDVDGPAMVLSVADLRGALRIPKSVTAPIPKQAIFAVRLEPDAAMCWATMVFDAGAQVDAFLAEWKGWRALAAGDKLMSLLGVPALMDKVELTRDDRRLLLRTRLTATQVGSLLGFVAIQVRQRAGERIESWNRLRGH